jgi:hypothetical protein
MLSPIELEEIDLPHLCSVLGKVGTGYFKLSSFDILPITRPIVNLKLKNSLKCLHGFPYAHMYPIDQE